MSSFRNLSFRLHNLLLMIDSKLNFLDIWSSSPSLDIFRKILHFAVSHFQTLDEQITLLPRHVPFCSSIDIALIYLRIGNVSLDLPNVTEDNIHRHVFLHRLFYICELLRIHLLEYTNANTTTTPSSDDGDDDESTTINHDFLVLVLSDLSLIDQLLLAIMTTISTQVASSPHVFQEGLVQSLQIHKMNFATLSSSFLTTFDTDVILE